MNEKGRTDEMDLFYGKFGANNILRPKGKLNVHQIWL
jgi:hypothetical protein